MRTYTICFEITGGISVEAENEEDALNYFNSEDGQADVGMCLSQNQVSVTEIYVEE